MVMSLARRRALLEFARQHKVWIIEDDYDSEFRYGSRPLSSLQGLDDAGQVIYVGSLGKMLYPGLRMGYMVVPENLVDTFRTGVAELYREGQLMQQAVLTEFILDGHLTSHVRRMRGLYGERRELLINAIRARFGETLAVRGDEAGLHFVLELPDSADDREIAASALSAGVVTRPLVNYYLNRLAARKGLMLGYACVPNDQIAPHFATLADVIEQAITSGSSKRAVTSIESARSSNACGYWVLRCAPRSPAPRAPAPSMHRRANRRIARRRSRRPPPARALAHRLSPCANAGISARIAAVMSRL